MENRLCRIVTVDLIDETLPILLNHRLAALKFPQQNAPTWPVNSGKPRSHPTRSRHHLLRFQQDFTRLTIWRCFRLFRHRLTVHLRIDRATGCKQQSRIRKPLQVLVATQS